MAAATIVGVPKKPLHLPTNYRTHSGILNAAAAVIDILKHYFSMVTALLLHFICKGYTVSHQDAWICSKRFAYCDE